MESNVENFVKMTIFKKKHLGPLETLFSRDKLCFLDSIFLFYGMTYKKSHLNAEQEPKIDFEGENFIKMRISQKNSRNAFLTH